MTKRLKWAVGLIVSSLFFIFILQAYYGYRVYQQHTDEFHKEVNNALVSAIDSAALQRVEEISHYFREDIYDTTLARISLAENEDGKQIYISDPMTGYHYVSIIYPEKLKKSDGLKNDLIEFVIKRNFQYLKEGSIMYWTDSIGERLKAYNDTVYVSEQYFIESFRKSLKTYDISNSFSVMKLKDSTFENNVPSGVYLSEPKPLAMKEASMVAIAIENPNYTVLRRSAVVLLLTLLVLVFLVMGFALLLRVLNKQRNLSQLKDDFIDNVTHELLTPVATLKLALETMSKDQSIGPSNKYLHLSRQQTQRIEDVVDHVLTVSFGEEGMPGIKWESFSLNTLLSEVITYHEMTAEKPVTFLYPSHAGLTVWSDRKHLANVLHNVLGNAIKYGPDDGVRVSIHVQDADNAVKVNITDNGPGIPKAERERIFEKFHRVNTNNTHDVKGLGIGLYYSLNIMKQLKGTLMLHSSGKKGSCFLISIPKVEGI